MGESDAKEYITVEHVCSVKNMLRNRGAVDQ